MTRYLAWFAILLSLFSFTAGLTGAIAGDEKQSLTAAEIINKHLASVGGKEALAKFKSRIAVGTIKKESDAEVKMAIVSEAPNRVSAIYVFENYDWQLTYDGKKSIVRPQFGKNLSAFQDKMQEMLASGLMFNSISLYNILVNSESYGAKFEAKGMKKIRDRATYVVEMRRPKVALARLYFDAETFMWVRTEYGKASITKPMGTFTNDVVPHGDDEITVDFYFDTSDFREADGVKLPYKFEQVVTSPILRQKKSGTISGTITEYQHNVDIDPKMFQ
jgi:hypothetical protein